MPFNVVVLTTRNGQPMKSTLAGVLDSDRSEVESDIRWFHEGLKPLEGKLTFHGRGGQQALRWADIKDIWIEES